MIFEKSHRINLGLILIRHYGKDSPEVVEDIIEYINYAIENNGLTEKEG